MTAPSCKRRRARRPWPEGRIPQRPGRLVACREVSFQKPRYVVVQRPRDVAVGHHGSRPSCSRRARVGRQISHQTSCGRYGSALIFRLSEPGRGQTVARVDPALGCRLLSGVVARSHLSSRRLASRERSSTPYVARNIWRRSDRRGSVPRDGPRDRGARTSGPTLHMQSVGSARVSASPAFGDRGGCSAQVQTPSRGNRGAGQTAGLSPKRPRTAATVRYSIRREATARAT